MASLVYAFHKHVVDINLYIPSYLWMKHMIYQPLISCPCVLQTEGHHFVAKQALAGDEGSLLLISFIHLDLVVS